MSLERAGEVRPCVPGRAETLYLEGGGHEREIRMKSIVMMQNTFFFPMRIQEAGPHDHDENRDSSTP